MRMLRWRHGAAWIAPSPDAWPDTLRWCARTSQSHTLTLPAAARGASRAVAVQRVCQTASGGSYFARVGAVLAPRDEGALVVTLTAPDDPNGDDAAREAAQAFSRMTPDELPMGALEVAWFVVHPVDFKPWAWRATLATVCRLLRDDDAAHTDDELATLAEAYGAPARWL